MARSVIPFDRAKRFVLLDRRNELSSEVTASPRLLSEVDRDGLTLLHYAAIKDKIDCLRVLVCAGGRVYDGYGGFLHSCLVALVFFR